MELYIVVGLFVFMIASFCLNKWPFGLTTVRAQDFWQKVSRFLAKYFGKSRALNFNISSPAFANYFENSALRMIFSSSVNFV